MHDPLPRWLYARISYSSTYLTQIHNWHMYTLYAGATKMLLHIDKNFTMGILISSSMVFICANMKLCIKIIFLNFISINGSYEKLVYYIFQNVKLGIPRHPVSDYGTFFCTNQNLHIQWMKTKYISAFLLLVRTKLCYFAVWILFTCHLEFSLFVF